jgi:Fur family ferric uptake transcriptional regulator
MRVATGPTNERNTLQRDAIVEAIESADGPLTVNEVHEAASRLQPGIGVATIYRNIKRLIESGQIHPVVLPDGQTRYEPAHLKHHHHFRCRKCDRVFDLHVCPVSVPHGTTLPGGYVIEDHELTLYGLCPQCADSDK